jgi:hypothetical protein
MGLKLGELASNGNRVFLPSSVCTRAKTELIDNLNVSTAVDVRTPEECLGLSGSRIQLPRSRVKRGAFVEDVKSPYSLNR